MKNRRVFLHGITVEGKTYYHPSLYPYHGQILRVEEKESGLAVFDAANRLICDGIKASNIAKATREDYAKIRRIRKAERETAAAYDRLILKRRS